MPRVWGSQVTASDGAKFRLGMDYSVSGTKITVSGYIAEFAGYYINDSSTRLTRTGSLSGSVYFPFRLNGGGTVSIPGSSGTITGTRGKSYTFGGRMDQLPYSGLSASVSTTVTISATTPSAPGRPSFSNTSPTGLTVSWAASSNSGGSSITGYLLRYYPRGSATGTYVNHSEANNRSRTVTGLNPGQEYTFVVLARNARGYSSASQSRTIRMMAGAWINVSGVWRLAAPYVKHNGVWKAAVPYVRHNGSWKLTT